MKSIIWILLTLTLIHCARADWNGSTMPPGPKGQTGQQGEIGPIGPAGTCSCPIDNDFDDQGNVKVAICHNGITLHIAQAAAQAHLSNHVGDYLGSCQ